MTNLEGWIPTGVEWSHARPAAVEWCYLGGTRFTDPFFEATLQRAMGNPFRLLFRRKTTLQVLDQRATTHPGIAPTGFIFHMSRCGSTLITQMLAASNENVVISEGWPIESAIGNDPRRPEIDDQHKARLLKGVVHALGQPRLGTETRYFIKFDAIHTLQLPLVRSVFPNVPWIFVYRDPLEVMVSQLMMAASWAMPGMVRGVPLTAACFTNRDEYLADLLALLCEAALREAAASQGMLLNYTEIPNAVDSDLAAHFRCAWSEDERERMEQATLHDAKNPEREFSPDSESKRRQAEERVREICVRKLGKVYDRLEAARRLQPGRKL